MKSNKYDIDSSAGYRRAYCLLYRHLHCCRKGRYSFWRCAVRLLLVIAAATSQAKLYLNILDPSGQGISKHGLKRNIFKNKNIDSKKYWTILRSQKKKKKHVNFKGIFFLRLSFFIL